MSSLSVEEDQKWVPTHVQVTVMRGRGLRGKGKHGTSDVYTIIQLGKEKYSTCVAEKTTDPEWKEECSFELQPGVLENGGRSEYPAGSNELVLTVMHRALIGLDVFLGQAAIQLDKVFRETRYVKNEWFRLHSKTGKKEKERGDIQVNVQFTRNNLTASMYELVMKDKGAFTFSKLKERMKGKRRSSEEDCSSILPGGYGSLVRMRQRLPSDGGGEEYYEDDEGGEIRRSKMRTFFLRGKLRKSSDTRSSTSLGSESSESSSRGGSLSPTAGISVVVSDLSNSPSNSSNLTADNSPEHTANTSPKSSSFKCEFGDEAGEITIVVPRPTVRVNGSHANNVQPLDPGSGKPAGSLGLGLLQKSLPLSVSLQNLSPRASKDLPIGAAGDGRRWSFDKPDEEEKAAIAAALEKSGPMLGEEELKAASSSSASTESEVQGKKQRKNLFSHGRSESAGKGQSQSRDESEQASAGTEERHKGWFGSKDSHSKPSLVVSPILEPSTHPHPPPLPPVHHPLGPPVDPASLVSTLHHTNPFYRSQSTPPPISPCNPFFSLLQQNPFYEDMVTTQQLKPTLPPLPYLSSSRPPIAQLFPQPNPNLTQEDPTTVDPSSEAMARLRRRPLPPTPTEGKKPLLQKPPNPFMSAEELHSELEECFEAFAVGRLQSPENLPTDCKTQQSTAADHPPEHCSHKGALKDAHQHTNVNEAVHQRPCPDAVFTAHTVPSTNMRHFDAFPQFLETIPEHKSFESKTFSTNSAQLDETKQDSSSTNTLTDTNMHHVPGHISPIQPSSGGSPDASSSGLGSSAEEDFLSGLSSHSDKFSASSSEEAESSVVLSWEKPSESAVVKNVEALELEDDTADRSLSDVVLQTVIQHEDSGGGEVGVSGAEESSLFTQPPPVSTAGEAGSDGADAQILDTSDGVYPESILSSDENTLDESVVVFSNTDVMIPAASNDKPTSPLPSVHITTSSPGDEKRSPDAEQLSLTFSDFLNISHIANGPNQDTSNTLLHTQTSDQSTSSFLQSLYVSVDSQEYQTCASHPSSRCSEPDETLHSANSTLCGDATTTDAASGLLFSTDASGSSTRRVSPTDDPEESLYGTQDEAATPEPSSTTGDDLLPAALRDSSMGFNPKRLSEGGAEYQPDILGDVSSTAQQPQNAPLHRTQSEGTLVPAFDGLLQPSFGSDPGAMQSSSAQPGPDLPPLFSFAPSLTPDCSSGPVAFFALPPFASASAWMPPSTAPEQEQQQQAANQQNSPHPVKPLTTATAEEKRSVLATGLEKLKSTIHPGRSSQLSEQDTDRKKCLTEGAGSYYHLTHNDLVALLVQREAELERQKVEFERQKLLLAKREVELRKLKPQVRDLEDYIDTLLVRIMEQKPTLLQVRSGSKFK
ncbi:rab11 family-interacting protein 1 isoform X2 [Parambassis ranga]|uniref:Rab11 family-interacting protein 1 isoform X2 n=1 Tax=Parambassis ranga TaxID=210632 RepID=A0A6P7HGI4_9TELE|nr:rab11 family-interacting protein 1-like isoform X2 [Parambassis ranga]